MTYGGKMSDMLAQSIHAQTTAARAAEHIPIARVIEWCRDNDVQTSDMINRDTQQLWLYKDGHLLRTFIVNPSGVNAHDFRNWCLHMGYEPVE